MTNPAAPSREPRTPAGPDRTSVLRALGLVLVGSLGIQTSAAISSGLFGDFGTYGTSAVRMLIAAVLMLVIVRPRLRGRGRREWLGICVYGVAMAAMNLCLYNAIDRIPLGVAVTLDFLEPCAIALLGSRRLREGLCALVAVAGSPSSRQARSATSTSPGTCSRWAPRSSSRSTPLAPTASARRAAGSTVSRSR
ncbi:EamA family transporter [Gulosibacter sediminis]|uniref:EamA family transporter n=1 Tax=Gulosibacter sediminis TaxID=1729695 RepID=UPI0024AD7641|nr:EamA family transporter [Gulosibacter sediminis]